MAKFSGLKSKLKELDKRLTARKIYIYFHKPKITLDMYKDSDLHIYLNMNKGIKGVS